MLFLKYFVINMQPYIIDKLPVTAIANRNMAMCDIGIIELNLWKRIGVNKQNPQKSNVDIGLCKSLI